MLTTMPSAMMSATKFVLKGSSSLVSEIVPCRVANYYIIVIILQPPRKRQLLPTRGRTLRPHPPPEKVLGYFT